MKRSTLFLVTLAASFIVSGIAEAAANPRHAQALGLAHGFLIGVMAYLWVKAEADERGAIPPGRSALLSGILPIVGVPLYFFRTRHWRQALAGCARLVALILTCAVGSAIASAATKHLLGGL